MAHTAAATEDEGDATATSATPVDSANCTRLATNSAATRIPV